MFDEDELFEEIDEEEEDTFPDNEDDDEEEYEERSYADPNQQTTSFLDDPWPMAAFILIIIGLVLVLFTPPTIWSAWHYYLIVTYGLIVLVVLSSVISLGVWRNAAGSRLRWGGLTNLFVVIISGVVGVLDSISIVTTGVSIIPGSNTPVLALAAVIVLFSLYTLWLIQRTFTAEARN
ncbi:MAG: hypothetical protein ACXAEF_11485 [Candidatus Thorarchaeota archaeon]|jgi:hypothetical protein